MCTTLGCSCTHMTGILPRIPIGMTFKLFKSLLLPSGFRLWESDWISRKTLSKWNNQFFIFFLFIFHKYFLPLWVFLWVWNLQARKKIKTCWRKQILNIDEAGAFQVAAFDLELLIWSFWFGAFDLEPFNLRLPIFELVLEAISSFTAETRRQSED